jgi:hypothetical protein
MHKTEIKAILGETIQKLRNGEVRPDVAHEIAHIAGRQINLMTTEISYAKARGEKPEIEELTTHPVTAAAKTLAKRQSELRAA